MSPAGPTEATPKARPHHRRRDSSPPSKPRASGPTQQPATSESSRPSIYHLMNKSPRLRTGGDISLEALKAAWERNSGDVAAMAAEFEVSEQGFGGDCGGLRARAPEEIEQARPAVTPLAGRRCLTFVYVQRRSSTFTHTHQSPVRDSIFAKVLSPL